MQAHKPTLALADPVRGLPAKDSSNDPRERFAEDAARPTVPQARSERLAGPFRVKGGYLERRAWPFDTEA